MLQRGQNYNQYHENYLNGMNLDVSCKKKRVDFEYDAESSTHRREVVSRGTSDDFSRRFFAKSTGRKPTELQNRELILHSRLSVTRQEYVR